MKYKTYFFKKIISTNDKAKEFIKKNISNIVIVAETQTKGRGRFGRKWYSSKGGLWFSIALKINNDKNLQYLTFIASIAVVKTIKQIFGIDAKIKWPNDIYYNKKKLCGILTEGIFGSEKHAVVGIGLNVNQTKFPKEIRNIATSLRIISNKNFPKKLLLIKILNEFNKLHKVYEERNYKKIQMEWKKHSDMLGKKVKVKTIGGEFNGKIINIDNDCALIIKTTAGKIKKIIEGDVFIL